MVITLLVAQTSKRLIARPCVASVRSSSTSQSGCRIAIARDIPDSFVDAVVAHHSADDSPVSLALAREQHHKYLSKLRRHVPTICLPAIEPHPDCLFVEDTVVAVGDTAVVTRLGHVSRRGEVDSIKDILSQLGMNVCDMRSDGDETEGALCDGGDVMFTGRHLFVGMSDRTNDRGYQFLRDSFSCRGLHEDDVISVPPVVAGKEVLHFKSAVTHIDEHTLLAPEGKIGDDVLKSMKATELGYDAIRLPDILSCNAVVVNGNVVAQDSTCEVSKQRIESACNERNLGLTLVNSSELAKKDGALTCCSVLIGV
ncbi:hypothetical protein ACHAWF_002037 [Thalassiosira exigua]